MTTLNRERTALVSALTEHRQELHTEWMAELRASGPDNRISDVDLKAQTAEFLKLLSEAVQQGNTGDLGRPEWKPVKTFLEGITRARVLQGFESDQTATFILSIKRPLFARLRQSVGDNIDVLVSQTWAANELLDKLGLHSMKAYEKSREEVINRQQEELLELSTPVIKLWDGVLALPMIGTLDSARTQVVMESLLHRIVETGAEIAIMDITGVPTVDTVVAQHLMKTVTAIRLMGADCIISGIRPQIAQTIVHLGVDLHGIVTKANLADALALAMKRTGFTVSREGMEAPVALAAANGFNGANGSALAPRAPAGAARRAARA